MRMYVVLQADESSQVIGVFNKEGLKAFLKDHKKKGVYSLNYSEDDKGVKKYLGRTKGYYLTDQIHVTSYPLNKQDYGRAIQWETFK
jgi:hypothetical protein